MSFCRHVKIAYLSVFKPWNERKSAQYIITDIICLEEYGRLLLNNDLKVVLTITSSPRILGYLAFAGQNYFGMKIAICTFVLWSEGWFKAFW
jgi:hypothetical protein